VNSLEAKPVFLTGFPKSGTTLLLSLLDGHPELCVFPKETKFFELAQREIKEDREEGVERFFARSFLGNQFGMQDPIRIQVEREKYLQALNQRWEDADFKTSAFLGAAVLAYGDVAGQTGRKWWVEKTPQTERQGRLLARWYPGIRMIYLVRDPRANSAAMKTWRQRSGLSIGVPWFCHGWAVSLGHNQRNRKYCPVLTLRYEDLVADTGSSMKRVCEFLEILSHSSMLSPTLGGEPFHGNSIYGDRFYGVSGTSLYKWREVLTAREVGQIQGLLGHLMQDLGYEPEPTGETGQGRAIDFTAAYLLKHFYDVYNKSPRLGVKLGSIIQSRVLSLVRPAGELRGSKGGNNDKEAR
jgi:hypothetical protein